MCEVFWGVGGGGNEISLLQQCVSPTPAPPEYPTHFYVLLTVHLSISLENDQLDTQLLYFTIRLL